MNRSIIAALATAVLIGASFAAGWRANDNRRDSQELAITKAAQQAGEAATSAAVDAIKTIEVRNVTIRQQAETITREVPVYLDCRHDSRMFDTINSALTPPSRD